VTQNIRTSHFLTYRHFAVRRNKQTGLNINRDRGEYSWSIYFCIFICCEQ